MKTRSHVVSSAASKADVEIDAGLRRYFSTIYAHMCFGLATTGFVAALFAFLVLTNFLINSGLMWLFVFAPLVVALILSFSVHKLNTKSTVFAFYGFAILMGISLSSIFLAYTGIDIARVFFITSGTFAAMSIWGYSTNRDLTKLGSFLIMGLIGILLASIVNIFIGSTAMQFAVSVLGVLIFTGLTAYDTQRLKLDYYEGADYKHAMFGALTLYLNFINLFVSLLQLLSNRNQ
jgi:FtsH-binding integral membrane protein